MVSLMGMMDDLTDQAKNLADKALDFAGDNPEKLDSALDKIGDVIDERTAGRFSEQIDSAEETISDRITDAGNKA